jgi:hypothetical protein
MKLTCRAYAHDVGGDVTNPFLQLILVDVFQVSFLPIFGSPVLMTSHCAVSEVLSDFKVKPVG